MYDPLSTKLAEISISEYKSNSPIDINVFAGQHKFIITIPSGPDDYWHQFILSITPSPQQQQHFDYRTGAKEKFTVTGVGVLERATKQPQYTQVQKQYFSQPQSVSLITENAPGSYFNCSPMNNDKLVGVIFDHSDVLLTNRLMLNSSGTATRAYDFSFPSLANNYFSEKREKNELFSEKEFKNFKYQVETNHKNNPEQKNEVLARIKWSRNSKIFIGSDTLEARLLAQDRARTLKARLQQQHQECGNNFNSSYEIPIVFYIPGNKLHGHEYNLAMQQADRTEAKEIFNNYDFIRNKFNSHDFEFLLGLVSADLMQALTYNIAVTQSKTPILLYILRQGYINLTQSLLQLAPSYDVNALQKYLYTDDRAFSMICSRTAQGSELIYAFSHMKQYISNIADYSLINAVKCGLTWHVEWLISKLNANPNEVVTRSYNQTCLHLACYYGYTQIVKLLLQAKADINEVDSGNFTPLHLACNNGHTEIVALLLQAKADINEVDSRNLTPLHLSCNKGRTEIVALLLQAKADINEVDSGNLTPLHLACKKGHTEITALLLKNGAKTEILTNCNACDCDLPFIHLK